MYTETKCLGINMRTNPRITNYISWDQLVYRCRTGETIRGLDKLNTPGVTYKGDYGSYRDFAHFTGKRSPYIVIDIDFAEKKNGIDKKSAMASDAVRWRVLQDIEIMIECLTDGYFFLKRSSSKAGIHMVLRINGMPEDIEKAKSVELFFQQSVQNRIEAISSTLNFHYSVDESLQMTSSVFYMSTDPNLIYDPTRPMIEMKEEYLGTPKPVRIKTNVDPTEDDREIFAAYAQECVEQNIRLEHFEIYKLSIIYFLLWPKGEIEHFVKLFDKFNARRAKDRPQPDYLTNPRSGIYAVGKKTMDQKIANPIGLGTLYKMSGQQPKKIELPAVTLDEVFAEMLKINQNQNPNPC